VLFRSLKLRPFAIIDILVDALTFFLLVANLVPISLYVSMKVARTLQAALMNADAECVYVDEAARARANGEAVLTGAGVFPLRVRSLELNDELGQITHVFSDKTGTLTSNDMVFRACSVAGVSYGLLEGGADSGLPVTVSAHVNFADGSTTHPGRSLAGDLAEAAGAAQHTALREFFLSLAANNTVVLDGAALSASSPDEEAFVLAAGAVGGQRLVARSRDVVTISESAGPGAGPSAASMTRRFRVVVVLPYSQARKMMSVVLEELSEHESGAASAAASASDALELEDLDGAASADAGREFLLLSKGADSRIYSRLAPTDSGGGGGGGCGDSTRFATERATEAFARSGLRTLCFARRAVPATELRPWLVRYAAAQASVAEKRRRDAGEPNAIDAAMEELERGLSLQGTTAVEDRLQEGVPQTISALHEAGIKIAVVTGDKVETAVNVAYACRLLNDRTELLQLTAEAVAPAEPAAALRRLVRERAHALVPFAQAESWAGRGGALGVGAALPPAPLELALVLDEFALDLLLGEGTSVVGAGDDCRLELLALLQAASSAVFCRARPDQKARIVRLVRAHIPAARTLAVGDGANDVDMIGAAHVGVGIASAEGLQAANAADFAIGRFRFLQRLLLVHGRWNYNRTSLLVTYSFYKNAVYAASQMPFVAFTLWSGTKLMPEVGAQASVPKADAAQPAHPHTASALSADAALAHPAHTLTRHSHPNRYLADLQPHLHISARARRCRL
jgi:phospholipid-transporting ATPase